jgi:serine protease Do
VITGIDGNMVLTIQAFSEKLYQCTSGQSMALTVKRLGKDGYKEIVFTVTIGEK